MTETLTVQNYRTIVDEKLELKQLTILTGENSSGKSTAIIAYLLPLYLSLPPSIQNFLDKYRNNASNIYSKADEIVSINLTDNKKKKFNFTIDNGKTTATEKMDLENRVIFLHADRISPSPTYSSSPSEPDDLGIRGEFAPFYFEKNKYSQVVQELCKDKNVVTLEKQVNYWLQHILKTTVKTEEFADQVVVKYSNGDEPAFLPYETGFGTSLLLPIIVACLSRKTGDVVIIENPEIHLHPKAQAALADFFAFVANAGVQVIIETHCEHLIYKLCYNVYQGNLQANDLQFYYKKKSEPFLPIMVDRSGKFVDIDGESTGFPSGFFDATVMNYLEMYR